MGHPSSLAIQLLKCPLKIHLQLHEKSDTQSCWWQPCTARYWKQLKGNTQDSKSHKREPGKCERELEALLRKCQVGKEKSKKKYIYLWSGKEGDNVSMYPLICADGNTGRKNQKLMRSVPTVAGRKRQKENRRGQGGREAKGTRLSGQY